jgi:hypothetical protein
VPPALKDRSDLISVYRALYSEAGASYEELYGALRTALGIRNCDVLLIGSHDGQERVLSGLVLETVRSIVERWPQPPDPIAGRSWSAIVRQQPVQPRRVLSNRAILRRLLRRVAGRGFGARFRGASTANIPALCPVPSFERRSVVLRSMGVPQLLYPSLVSGCTREQRGRVHVYVDVSGSIGDLKGALYGAVTDCADVVHRTVHLFSTEVHDVSFEALRRGKCRTTGGTSIECVAAHMCRERVHHAVLLTDGFVGTPGSVASETLRHAAVGVALTPGYGTRTDLDGVVRFWEQLHGG